MSLQAIVNFIRYLLPWNWVLGFVLAWGLMWFYGAVVKYNTNRKWRLNLKHHMDEVYREELEKRDAKIVELSAERDLLKKWKSDKIAVMRGAKAMIQKAGEVL